MDDSPTAPPRRPLRWYQLRSRTLLISVTLGVIGADCISTPLPLRPYTAFLLVVAGVLWLGARMALRRFQPPLRTLLIGVTVLIGVTLFSIPCCVYIGWQARIVRERKEWIEEHSTNCYVNYYTRDHVSQLRAMFGDRPYGVIAVPPNTSKDERAKLKAIFPEAVILALNPNFSWPKDADEATKRELAKIPQFIPFTDGSYR